MRSRDSDAWRLLGRVSARQMGLPKRDARRLRLHTAWRAVAGAKMADRVSPGRLSRGLLELRVADEGWWPTLVALAPRLAGTLALRWPEFGIRRVRLSGPGGLREGSRPVVIEDAPEPENADECPPGPAEPPSGDPLERLRRAASRYLQRSQCDGSLDR